jgi:hypothetical protein
LDKTIRRSQKDRASGLILGPLVARYVDEKGLRPTREEIETFVARARERDAAEKTDLAETKRRLSEMLKGPGLSPADAERLRADLARTDRLLREDPEMSRYEHENPEEVRGMEEALAREYVQNWKVTRSLFRQYGGRIAFPQTGPEPVDAYRDFLREQEKKGNLSIMDRQIGAAFWNYFTNDLLHTFVTTNREQGAALLDTPWWMVDRKGKAEQRAPAGGAPRGAPRVP